MERLSSGFRINRAADDAAGLVISEKLRGQVKGLAQAQRNVGDAISLVQTAEGAMDQIHSMLDRVRELAVQYGNGALSAADKPLSSPRSRSSARTSSGSARTRSSTASSCSAAPAARSRSRPAPRTVRSSPPRRSRSPRAWSPAAEMAQMTKYQILSQAGMSMLAQANQAPQGVLSLLR